MLDESEVLALIARPEGPNLDFKRELTLETAKGKSELIKDIIAIANSDRHQGHLIYGVNDDRQIVGISELNEEQIQQLAHRYITPPVVLSCELIPLAAQGFISVGVVVIKPTSRPHKVKLQLDKLNQDEVFIRRGSITTKASPEELFQMYEEHLSLQHRVEEFKRAADTHIKLGNYPDAIKLLSKAIEIGPTAEIFLARAEAFYELRKVDPKNSSSINWGEKALRDLGDAIILAPSPEFETNVRILRHNTGNFNSANYTSKQKEEDFECEKLSKTGLQRGEWIYEWVSNSDPILGATDKTILLIQEAIDCGYNEPKVYYLLAEAYHGAYNYGLALNEINKLLASIDEKYDKSETVKFLCFQAKILVEMKRYKEADETLLKAKKIDASLLDQFFWITTYKYEEDILFRSLLEGKFKGKTSNILKNIVELIVFSYSRNIFQLTTRPNEKVVIGYGTELDLLEKEYPKIMIGIKTIVDNENWLALKTKEQSEIKFSFPSILNELERIKREGYKIKL